jgi:hypothetical protein
MRVWVCVSVGSSIHSYKNQTNVFSHCFDSSSLLRFLTGEVGEGGGVVLTGSSCAQKRRLDTEFANAFLAKADLK